MSEEKKPLLRHRGGKLSLSDETTNRVNEESTSPYIIESIDFTSSKSDEIVTFKRTPEANTFYLDMRRAFLTRIHSFAAGAIFAIIHSEAISDTDKSKKIEQIKDLYNQCEKTLSINNIPDGNTLENGTYTNELTNFQQDLCAISGLTESELELAEGIHVWQDIDQPQTHITTYPVTSAGVTYTIEQIDHRIQAPLTQEQKDEIKKIHNSPLPYWFAKLPPWVQNYLKEITPPRANDWEQYEKNIPSILRQIPGQANATLHELKVWKGEAKTGTLVSYTQSIRQGAPTSLYMPEGGPTDDQGHTDRQRSAIQNFQQLLDNNRLQTWQANFKTRWGLPDETKITFPVFVGGLLSPADQLTSGYALWERNGGGNKENNTKLVQDQQRAIDSYNFNGSAVYNINIAINKQRDETKVGDSEKEKNFSSKMITLHATILHKVANDNIAPPEGDNIIADEERLQPISQLNNQKRLAQEETTNIEAIRTNFPDDKSYETEEQTIASKLKPLATQAESNIELTSYQQNQLILLKRQRIILSQLYQAKQQLQGLNNNASHVNHSSNAAPAKNITEVNKTISRLDHLLRMAESLEAIEITKSNNPIHNRNKNLFLAAQYELVMRHAGGMSIRNCKSSKDRTGTLFMMVDAMEIFRSMYGYYPQYDQSIAEREKFVTIFAQVYLSTHQLREADYNSPGSAGIKDEGILDKDMREAIGKDAYKKSGELGNLNKPGSFIQKKIIAPLKRNRLVQIFLLSLFGLGFPLLAGFGIFAPLSPLVALTGLTGVGAGVLNSAFSLAVIVPILLGARAILNSYKANKTFEAQSNQDVGITGQLTKKQKIITLSILALSLVVSLALTVAVFIGNPLFLGIMDIISKSLIMGGVGAVVGLAIGLLLKKLWRQSTLVLALVGLAVGISLTLAGVISIGSISLLPMIAQITAQGMLAGITFGLAGIIAGLALGLLSRTSWKANGILALIGLAVGIGLAYSGIIPLALTSSVFFGLIGAGVVTATALIIKRNIGIYPLIWIALLGFSTGFGLGFGLNFYYGSVTIAASYIITTVFAVTMFTLTIGVFIAAFQYTPTPLTKEEMGLAKEKNKEDKYGVKKLSDDAKSLLEDTNSNTQTLSEEKDANIANPASSSMSPHVPKMDPLLASRLVHLHKQTAVNPAEIKESNQQEQDLNTLVSNFTKFYSEEKLDRQNFTYTDSSSPEFLKELFFPGNKIQLLNLLVSIGNSIEENQFKANEDRVNAKKVCHVLADFCKAKQPAAMTLKDIFIKNENNYTFTTITSEEFANLCCENKNKIIEMLEKENKPRSMEANKVVNP